MKNFVMILRQFFLFFSAACTEEFRLNAIGASLDTEAIAELDSVSSFDVENTGTDVVGRSVAFPFSRLRGVVHSLSESDSDSYELS